MNAAMLAENHEKALLQVLKTDERFHFETHYQGITAVIRCIYMYLGQSTELFGITGTDLIHATCLRYYIA